MVSNTVDDHFQKQIAKNKINKKLKLYPVNADLYQESSWHLKVAFLCD